MGGDQIRLASYQNKLAAQQRKWENNTEKETGVKDLWGLEGGGGGGRKKPLSKAESRELSPQLSVHQEVSPRESALTSLITEAATGSSTKRKGSKHQLQEVHFFYNFGSTKSGP